MKNAVVEACDNLYNSYNASIAVFYIAYILDKLNLVDTSIDKHAGMWKISTIMAIDHNLVKDVNFYGGIELRKYGVVGNPLNASFELGPKFLEVVINYIEEFIRSFKFSGCYYNWLDKKRDVKFCEKPCRGVLMVLRAGYYTGLARVQGYPPPVVFAESEK